MTSKLAGQADSPAPRQTRDKKPAGSLARGLAILDVIRDAVQPMVLADIAAAAHLNHSTTLRLLRVLAENGYIVRMADSKGYAPSPKVILPLPLMHPISQVRRDVYPLICELSTTLSETILLALYLGLERMAIDVAQTSGSLTPYYDAWLHGPRHATGVGKALLLSLGPERRRAILGSGPLPAITSCTITDPLELERDLALAEERGFVVSRDEQHVGLTAIAANIPTWRSGHVGCLAVTGHTRNLHDERIAQVGEELSRFAKLLAYQVPSLNSVAHYLSR